MVKDRSHGKAKGIQRALLPVFSLPLIIAGCTIPIHTSYSFVLKKSSDKPQATQVATSQFGEDRVQPFSTPGNSRIVQTKLEEVSPSNLTGPSASLVRPVELTPVVIESSPIDLPTALRLAGANNLQIALAAERLRQAEARLDGATALWLPSINVGVGYNTHSGPVQDTTGRIVDVNRDSWFVGGGPVLGNFPLPGGAAPPPRLFLGLPIADAVFTRLAERQQVEASRAETTTAFNDTSLRVGLAYLDLVAAYQQSGIARQAEANAKELNRILASRVQAGTTPPADGLRARTELADRERLRQKAEETVKVASAEMARLLRLDPALVLIPAETEPAPIELVPLETPLLALIEQGLTQRPELAQNQALVRASLERLRQERWRPWIPTVALGYSGGEFAGGSASISSQSGRRSDFDAVVAWDFRNLGLGNRALQRQEDSLFAQAGLNAEQIRDNILAEVATAYHQIQSRREQVEAARRQLVAAKEALPLNFKGIVDGPLRAIEAQQAVQALAAAQTQFLTSVTEYNQAQFRLLRAIGRTPESCPTCGPSQ